MQTLEEVLKFAQIEGKSRQDGYGGALVGELAVMLMKKTAVGLLPTEYELYGQVFGEIARLVNDGVKLAELRKDNRVIESCTKVLCKCNYD